MPPRADHPGLVARSRTASRAVVLAALGVSAGSAIARRPLLGPRGQQALTLGVLALGMPHGAADTELLRALGHGDRRRHLGLLGGYATAAVAATAVLRSGRPWVDRLSLAASAAHFAEGELACWGPAAPDHHRGRTGLRFATAAITTALLPAAVGSANRRGIGASGVVDSEGSTDRSGLSLLRRAHGATVEAAHRDSGGGASARVGPTGARRAVAGLSALALGGAGLLAATGDRRAAADSVLLLALDLVASPSLGFAAYFGGWHSLRHTARVADTMTARGLLPAQASLPQAITTLGRRSAWAAGVGIAGAGVLAAAQPDRMTDNAFAAVLGLTVPHMATVTAALARPVG